MKILEDMRDISQDWFNEVSVSDIPNLSNLESIDFDLYESCCELIGNMILELFIGTDGFYYMLQKIRQPIGDYGYHWCDRWHKCEERYVENISEIIRCE